jgi:hypothetical protein
MRLKVEVAKNHFAAICPLADLTLHSKYKGALSDVLTVLLHFHTLVHPACTHPTHLPNGASS